MLYDFNLRKRGDGVNCEQVEVKVRKGVLVIYPISESILRVRVSEAQDSVFVGVRAEERSRCS